MDVGPTSSKTPPLKPLIRLEPSPRNPDLCSIFTDAAWNPSTGVAGLGWVIDDLVSPSQHSAVETSVSSPLMAETLAVRTAMTFALSCRFESITIFSDSQILINLITRKMMNLEIFGVLKDIYLLSTAFKSITFSFIPHLQNAKADPVAKQTLWASNPV